MASKKKTTAKAPAAPSKKRLAEYFQLEEKKREASREVADINRLQDEIEADVLNYVRDAGGPERCAMLHGYRLAIDIKPERVEWKTELLKALAKHIGQQKAVRIAGKILKEAGTKEVPMIEPPASKSPPSTKTKPPAGLLF